MGAQALQNSQPLMLHASLSRQSAMVLTMVVAVSPWGMILHPSIIVFSFSYEVLSKFALIKLSMYWGVHRMLALA